MATAPKSAARTSRAWRSILLRMPDTALSVDMLMLPGQRDPILPATCHTASPMMIASTSTIAHNAVVADDTVACFRATSLGASPRVIGRTAGQWSNEQGGLSACSTIKRHAVPLPFG